MRRRSPVTIRSADASHARRLHALIAANLEEGRLLPRTLVEIKTHADRFVIGVRGPTIVGCAELAPLGAQVAEVRSLAVDGGERGAGVGAALVDELRRRARRDGYEKLCVFTHAPGYFIGMGFSIVPHLWLLEKLFTDCMTCPHFRHCGQYAMVVPLDDAPARAHEEVRTRPLEVVMSVPSEA
jgi:amino-acid N-acetyltransferase